MALKSGGVGFALAWSLVSLACGGGGSNPTVWAVINEVPESLSRNENHGS